MILKSKGYENIKDSGKYLSFKTPYYSRNVRINRAFGEKYSVEGIKERIYGYIYVHYLYFFEILPTKNQYKELSPEYYNQKQKII